jgi:hypothetical protein
MTDQEALKTITEGFDFVCHQARLIAMMPIEDWLQILEHAESIAPITDPTLYRQYLYSKKPEILKKVLRSALELKRTIEEIQPDVLEEMTR